MVQQLKSTKANSQTEVNSKCFFLENHKDQTEIRELLGIDDKEVMIKLNTGSTINSEDENDILNILEIEGKQVLEVKVAIYNQKGDKKWVNLLYFEVKGYEGFGYKLESSSKEMIPHGNGVQDILWNDCTQSTSSGNFKNGKLEDGIYIDSNPISSNINYIEHKVVKGQKLNDKCKIVYNNFDIYDGEVDSIFLLPNGFGVLEKEDKTKIEGFFENGALEGKGKIIYKDNFRKDDVYEGNFKDGKKQGKGVYLYSNGDVYEGNFRNDEPFGSGILKLKYSGIEIPKAEWTGKDLQDLRLGKNYELNKNGEIKTIQQGVNKNTKELKQPLISK